MSGDVQPRKRKDKKKKKDDLGLEEPPRGTAAALGEGDVFMHSHHDHGTGGHWCAKIIFFSLLAVLIGLIGLIILENRGLSELEAQAVESRYSGVLEGWLEDAPDDDHHDVHTLELKHHDDHEDDDDHDESNDNEVDEHDDEENSNGDDEDDDHGEETEEDDDDHDIDAADDEDKRSIYSRYFSNDDEDEETEQDDGEDEEPGQDDDEDEEAVQNVDEDEEAEQNEDEESGQNDEDDEELEQTYDDEEADEGNDDNDEENEDNDENQSNEIEERDEKEENSFEVNEEDGEDEEADHDDDDEEDEEEVEVEKIEHEASDEEPISVELPALPEEDDDDRKDDADDDGDDQADQDSADDDQADDNEQDEDTSQADDGDDDFLDPDDDDDTPIEKITTPAGKPFVEVEEEISSEKPPDTLEEEEEYEKQQEQKRQEEAQASHIWLKVAVGGLLMAATHAVFRRATSSDTPEPEETPTREATPLIDRRMTLIPEEMEPVPKKFQEISKPVVEEVVKQVSSSVKFAPPPKQESEDEEEIEEVEMEEEKQEDEKELYSDEDEEEEVEVEESKVAPEPPKPREPTPESEPEEDVEIIDEVLDEEVEEELDEEEISDVDDAELLTRLEEKYGRLPEPERPGQKFYKDGGNSVEDDWPGEPSDPYWRKQLDAIDQELRQGAWSSALERASVPALANSARARYIAATALDKGADTRRDNALLMRAINAYIHLLKMSEHLSDEKLLMVTNRTLQRIQFRGIYLKAEPVYRLLIRRFPDEPAYRNNLTVAFLMANRVDLAEGVLKETLKLWPNDRLALAHYGFVLKNEHNKLEEAVDSLQKALKDDTGPACEPRYYYHLGDALLLLGRHAEAHEVHKRGAKHGHFLSPSQRSLYNVPRLKSRPWWNVDETPYVRLARSLERSWKEILKEGEAARALYEKEKEGLKERGDWSQLDLFVRGQEIPGRCENAPVTCSIVKTEPAAVGCRRGQIKFSAMEPGTHVRPHVGPTNCRIRMHLGLSNTKDTYIRVDQEIRQWQEGKVLIFDDSFEHEVWHNGTGKRLVLILDVWHPDLTLAERRQLPAI